VRCLFPGQPILCWWGGLKCRAPLHKVPAKTPSNVSDRSRTEFEPSVDLTYGLRNRRINRRQGNKAKVEQGFWGQPSTRSQSHEHPITGAGNNQTNNPGRGRGGRRPVSFDLGCRGKVPLSVAVCPRKSSVQPTAAVQAPPSVRAVKPAAALASPPPRQCAFPASRYNCPSPPPMKGPHRRVSVRQNRQAAATAHSAFVTAGCPRGASSPGTKRLPASARTWTAGPTGATNQGHQLETTTDKLPARVWTVFFKGARPAITGEPRSDRPGRPAQSHPRGDHLPARAGRAGTSVNTWSALPACDRVALFARSTTPTNYRRSGAGKPVPGRCIPRGPPARR